MDLKVEHLDASATEKIESLWPQGGGSISTSGNGNLVLSQIIFDDPMTLIFEKLCQI